MDEHEGRVDVSRFFSSGASHSPAGRSLVPLVTNS